MFPADQKLNESRMYLEFTLIIDVLADWDFTLYAFTLYAVPTLGLCPSSLHSLRPPPFTYTITIERGALPNIRQHKNGLNVFKITKYATEILWREFGWSYGA